MTNDSTESCITGLVD